MLIMRGISIRVIVNKSSYLLVLREREREIVREGGREGGRRAAW